MREAVSLAERSQTKKIDARRAEFPTPQDLMHDARECCLESRSFFSAKERRRDSSGRIFKHFISISEAA